MSASVRRLAFRGEREIEKRCYWVKKNNNNTSFTWIGNEDRTRAYEESILVKIYKLRSMRVNNLKDLKKGTK